MKIISIIQSRMTSQRYPGKMLVPFLGKPLIAHVVDRIKLSKVNLSIILATSDNQTDDPLAIYAKNLGINVVRGSLHDVMKRFTLTLEKYKSDAFFRVCGDSPLILPYLFDKAVSVYRQSDYDLVTNVFPRSFPAGMSIELIKTSKFLEVEKKIKHKKYREHITQYFYNKKKDFKIYNISCKNLLDPNLMLALDKPGDLIKLEEWERNRDKDYKKLFPIIETK
jgi:spore coat polysaccharide biosynthesis protein SpsF (cytidylyltransferase family)